MLNMDAQTSRERLKAFSSLKLDGFHVLLRPPRPDDCHEWLRLRKRNKNFLKSFEPKWAADALTPEFYRRKYLRQQKDWQSDTSYAFLIFTADYQEKMIGAINIAHIQRGASQQATLGYWIDQEHQGMGYMSAAIRRIIHFSGKTLKLERLNAATIEENTRSQNTLTRLGFKQEGYARRYIEINGERRDHLLFGLIIDEFIQRDQQ